ncbi:MAG: substrate-binding domain-containing protein [Planctomycetia bacterium]|nr:substrate-binding domain-containing protein [Planctomycetia bacterium]
MSLRRTEKVDQVRQQLIDRIHNGFFRAGDRFLSNRETADQFGISYQTAHRLIVELCGEGMLERRPKSGTYVPGDKTKLVGVQLLFHPRAAQAGSFGSKLLTLLQRKLEAEGIDMTCDLYAKKPKPATNRLPIIWEMTEMTAACTARQVPAILINQRAASGLESLYVDSVSTDDFSGGVCAAQVLGERVKKKRGFTAVSGPEGDSRSNLRLQGFLSVLPANVVCAGNWFFDQGYAAAEQILKSAKAGIFCVNDQLASGVLQWCVDHSRSCPPIVGFDDAPVAEKWNLTTISLPWEEMLDGVVRIAKLRLTSDRSASSHQMFHPRPILRRLDRREPNAEQTDGA